MTGIGEGPSPSLALPEEAEGSEETSIGVVDAVGAVCTFSGGTFVYRPLLDRT